ncbi:MAG: hypothetical protein QY312_00885 [Candidatus Dojkabacteria bacterium]|nr:MAG: hypothetical protein QY312_00885 [Candidatus Dojkabacteria bacterium]
MTAKQYDTISFGLLVIFVGVTAFLVTSGYLEALTIFSIITLIWPALLIFAGLKILLEARFGKGMVGVLFDILTYLILLAVFLFGKAWLLPSYQNPAYEQVEREISEDQYPTVTSKVVALTFGAAELTVRDVSGPSLFKISGPEGFTVNTSEENDVLSISASNEQKKGFLRFAQWGVPVRYSVDVGKTSIPTTLSLNLGASKSNLFFDKTNFTELTANVGAGDADITLSRTSLPKHIDIKVGAGKTVLTLIGTDAIKVDYSVGAGSLTITNTQTQETKNFGGIGTNGSVETSATPLVTIDVSVGAGAVEIRLQP